MKKERKSVFFRIIIKISSAHENGRIDSEAMKHIIYLSIFWKETPCK